MARFIPLLSFAIITKSVKSIIWEKSAENELTRFSMLSMGVKSYRIRGRILYDQYEYELKLYQTNTRRYEIQPHCIFPGRIQTRSYWYKVVSTRIFIRVKYEYDHFLQIQRRIRTRIERFNWLQRSPWHGETYGKIKEHRTNVGQMWKHMKHV